MNKAIEHLDLEDDYPEYVDETWGYAWSVWDISSAAVIERHDSILADATEEDPAGLTNLERWALVRHQQNSGESFLDVLRLILSNREDQAGVNLAEIYEFAVRAFAARELFDEAQLTEDALDEHWPEYTGTELARASRKILEGVDTSEVIEPLLDKWSEDADQLIELANELKYLGRLDEVRTTLAAARTAAQDSDDRPSLLDIQLILESLPE